MSAAPSVASAGSTPRAISSSRRSAPATSSRSGRGPGPSRRPRPPTRRRSRRSRRADQDAPVDVAALLEPRGLDPHVDHHVADGHHVHRHRGAAYRVPLARMRPRAIERGERVHLRHPRPDDEDAFIAAVRASRRLHRPWAQLPDSPAAFATLIERQELPSEMVYLICPERGRRARRHGEPRTDLLRAPPGRVPRLLGVRAARRPRPDVRGRPPRAAPGVRSDRAAPGRGERAAGERALDRARRAPWGSGARATRRST